MRKLKKILASLLATLMLFFVFVIAANANTVDLYKNEYGAYSYALTAKQAVFNGTNFSESSHAVYFCSQCLSTTGNYTDDVTVYVAVGANCPLTTTTSTYSAISWRLYLNPFSLYRNCRATGTISRSL